MRPGREHAVTRARTHPDLLDAGDAFSVDGRFVLLDRGYEGEDRRLVTPYKQLTVPRRKGQARRKKLPLAKAQKVINTPHPRLRSRAEQGNARLKVTFEALRRASLNPWRIQASAAAALVLLHWGQDRTT